MRVNDKKLLDNARSKATAFVYARGWQSGYFIGVGVKGGVAQIQYANWILIMASTIVINHLEGVTHIVVVDKKSFLYLVGTTLDFSGGLNGKGFVFNPNADRTCGCGESFSL